MSQGNTGEVGELREAIKDLNKLLVEHIENEDLRQNRTSKRGAALQVAVTIASCVLAVTGWLIVNAAQGIDRRLERLESRTMLLEDKLIDHRDRLGTIERDISLLTNRAYSSSSGNPQVNPRLGR